MKEEDYGNAWRKPFKLKAVSIELLAADET